MDYFIRRERRRLIEDLIELQSEEDLQRQHQYILRGLERSRYYSDDDDDEENRNSQPQRKEYCLVKVTYQNPNTRQRQHIDEITIIQHKQIIFKGCLQDGDEFIFKSKRYRNDSRLKLKFYVNDFLEDEMTGCCEYDLINRNQRHHLFEIENIIGAKPCYDCEFNYDSRSSSPIPSSKTKYSSTKTKTPSSEKKSALFIPKTQKNEAASQGFPADITEVSDYQTKFNDRFDNEHQSDEDSIPDREFPPKPTNLKGPPQLSTNTKWKQEGITIAGGNGQGNQLNQLDYPEGIFIDTDQTISIADCSNHRIVEWKCNATNGQIVVGGNGEGYQTNQLYYPASVIIDKENNSLIISDFGNRRIMRWSLEKNTKNGQIIIENINCYGLTMDKNGSLYVSDIEKNEVRRWKRGDKNGTIVAGGNGKGNNLNQLDYPNYIFVDEDYSLYVSEMNNHRVMKWFKDAKEGIVVAGGNGQGNSLKQLSCPHGVIVDLLGQIYVADYENHRVMRWCKEAKEGTIVVGGNGQGQQSNQFCRPTGLFFDRERNLYVADRDNNRIQKFEIN